MEKSNKLNKNLVCLLLAILIVCLYYLIDGFEMFRNDYLAANDLFGSNILLNGNPAFEEGYAALKYHIASLINLSLVLIPIVFVGLRFRISLKKKAPSEKTDVKWLISIARCVVGVMGFYYMLTLGTIFSHETFTEFYSFNLQYSFFRIVFSFAILACCLIDWPVFIKALKNLPVAHPWLYRALFIIGISVLSCCITEFQIGSKMKVISTMLLYNILYWLLLQLVIDLITPSVKIGAISSLTIAFLIGLINDIVYQFRGNYVMFGDLTVVRTAMEVAGNYVYKPGIWLFVAIALLIVGILVTILLKFPQDKKAKDKKSKVRELVIRGVTEAVLIAGIIVTFNTGVLYKHINGVGWDYNKNVTAVGYVPYFLSNMNAIGDIDCVGYSAQLAQRAIGTALAGSDTSDSEEYITPNIILIQNEAFSDLSVVYDIETDQDYMPFIHSLTENTCKGYLNMSVTGGPTANTEFEILTGSTLQFFPFGSVPYTQYIDHDLPSVVSMLESQQTPYHTVAYHSYYSTGYKRPGIYSYFGFDEMRFEDNFHEDFPKSDLVRNMVSDEADYRIVEQMYEQYREGSTDPWFCFNVTIQGHGGYTGHYDFEDKVTVTNFEATEAVNNYLTLMKISDTAFEGLIEYFSNVDEPTVIIMYGDHQPKFDEESVELLTSHPADYAPASLAHFYVPYVIWANYDIEEQDLMSPEYFDTLSTNYLVSYALDIAGVRLSDYDRYLLEVHNKVPAITAIGVWDSEGTYAGTAAESSEAETLKGLEFVQYNRIFDEENLLVEN
nr:sulfatase-like hydrolase/transferase [Saccharofermentans sp.]